MPYAWCSFSCHAAPMPQMSRPPEMMSTCAAILATTAGWRYVLPETIVPMRRRGTIALSAASVVQHSIMSPVRAGVEGVMARDRLAQREDDNADALLQIQAAERPAGGGGADRDLLHADGAGLAQHRVEHGDDRRPQHLGGQAHGADRLVGD